MFRDQIIDHAAVLDLRIVGTECRHHETEEREQSDDTDQNKEDITPCIVSGEFVFILFFLIHYWNPPSSLTDGSAL